MTGRVGFGLVLALLGASAAWAVSRADESRFPHAKHAGMFPTCIGCHEGILDERATDRYPDAAQCAGCHDGEQAARVEWDGPRRAPSNLRFSHVEHDREADPGVDPALRCGRCHAQPGDTAFMAVGRERARLCLDCHEHRATAHLVDAACRTCHVTLAQAQALSDSAVAAFPRPPSHDRPDFVEAHDVTGPESEARCAVCHARESCARCHANAAGVPAIAALERDPRAARIVAAMPAAYPVPRSHRDPDFAFDHGREARARIETCANCHTRPSCRACHTGAGASRVIARLPEAGEGGPAGVRLRGEDPGRRRAPAPAPDRAGGSDGAHDGTAERLVPSQVAVRVHPAGFATTHGPAAASKQLGCEGCHVRTFCSDCHGGEGERRFHPPNFLVRHAPEAYGRMRDCASCHNTEGFCKDCHQAQGTAASGRRDAAFHTGQPLWLLQHGQAARQGLESCASCHAQRDCMQCHSTLGWGISPHGPGFDARRMARRNSQMCGACHLGGPPSSAAPPP